MKKFLLPLIVFLFLALALVLANCVYVVKEAQQVILTQFGQPVGVPITEPGLHFRTPFIQKPNYLEKRVLEWDGDPNEVTTKDKRYIRVDTFARWRISEPRKYFETVVFEVAAQSRLDDILDGETRSALANHNLIEVLRNSQRELVTDEGTGEVIPRDQIQFGRNEIAKQVLQNASARAEALGIEVLDFRFKRINYQEKVRLKVYERMRS